jgi:hypothetical protein
MNFNFFIKRGFYITNQYTIHLQLITRKRIIQKYGSFFPGKALAICHPPGWRDTPKLILPGKKSRPWEMA